MVVEFRCSGYLYLSAEVKVVIDYRDDALVGRMIETDNGGRLAEVTLNPRFLISKESDVEMAKAFHHIAHELCFTANSMNFSVLTGVNRDEILEMRKVYSKPAK